MSVTIPRFDDWHLHLRDGEALEQYVYDSALQCRRALIMPNLTPPVTNATLALEYRTRILTALASKCQKLGVNVPSFEPVMSLYLTQNTTPEIIREAAATKLIKAVKLYPAGATTNSDNGVTDIAALSSVFQAMAENGMILCVHGEVTDPSVDIFDREAVFLKGPMTWLVNSFPSLKIILEHATTAEGVKFVQDAVSKGAQVAATFTAHHLLCNRNDLLAGGLHPHYYCLPVLKAEQHRRALVEAATSGASYFFAGSDSAPHAKDRKECSHGCAGCYTAPALAQLYAEAFDNVGKLDQLQSFLCSNGAKFYGVEDLNADENTQLHLKKQDWTMQESVTVSTSNGENVVVVPFRGGEKSKMKWALQK